MKKCAKISNPASESTSEPTRYKGTVIEHQQSQNAPSEQPQCTRTVTGLSYRLIGAQMLNARAVHNGDHC